MRNLLDGVVVVRCLGALQVQSFGQVTAIVIAVGAQHQHPLHRFLEFQDTVSNGLAILVLRLHQMVGSHACFVPNAGHR